MVWWANSAHYHYTRAGALRSRMLERILSLSIVAMVMMSQSPSGSPVLVSQMSGKSTPTSTSGTRAAYQTDTELYRLLVVVMVFAMCTAFCLCLWCSRLAIHFFFFLFHPLLVLVDCTVAVSFSHCFITG